MTFRATKVGQVTNCASATTEDGLRVENCTTTQITAPQLAVTKTGPDTAVVGVPITYTITITNPGNGPATNVALEDSFDAGLEHESKANPVAVQVGTLNAGETKSVPLVLTPKQVGKLNNRVTAKADGGLIAKAEHPVTVQKAQLAVAKTGPTLRYVGRNAVWDLKVTNPADTPLTSVTLRDQLPAELGFISASDGGQLVGNEVVWNLGNLQPRESRSVNVTTKCLKLARQATNVAIATANPVNVPAPPDQPILKVQAEAPIEIGGLPAFRLEVVDVDDPIEVGGQTTYRIDVTNQGSLPGTQVGIIAIVPPEMQILRANGPGQPKIEGQKITFPPVDSVQPNQQVSYTVDVKALKEGDVRFHVELRSLTLGAQPVIEEESTRIYAPLPGGAGSAGAGLGSKHLRAAARLGPAAGVHVYRQPTVVGPGADVRPAAAAAGADRRHAITASFTLQCTAGFGLQDRHQIDRTNVGFVLAALARRKEAFVALVCEDCDARQGLFIGTKGDQRSSCRWRERRCQWVEDPIENVGGGRMAHGFGLSRVRNEIPFLVRVFYQSRS